MPLCRLDDLSVTGKKISINDIEAIDVLKQKTATGIYGDKGKNGIILITTTDGVVKKNNCV